MFKALMVLFFIIYVAIGVTSYALIAGTRADWWQFVTYVWIFFWPVVLGLGLFYYSTIPFLIVLAALVIGTWKRRRRPLATQERRDRAAPRRCANSGRLWL